MARCVGDVSHGPTRAVQRARRDDSSRTFHRSLPRRADSNRTSFPAVWPTARARATPSAGADPAATTAKDSALRNGSRAEPKPTPVAPTTASTVTSVFTPG